MVSCILVSVTKEEEEFMNNQLKTLYFKYKEIINYLIVGGLTTVVSLVTYYLCVLTFLDPGHPVQLQIANVISWIFAVTFAYFTNRKYVFESKVFLRCPCHNTAHGYGIHGAAGLCDPHER